MPLSRLQNFLRNPSGSILYVDPNNFEATDSFQNRGDSATTPFKTIQRALIESARFSFRTGINNDRNDRTTISVSSGVHYIDNRPGFSLNLIDSNTAEFKRITAANTWSSATLNEFDVNSNFNIFDESNDLYKYNSVEGGVILPRGTSIVGLDLRKTKIRPLYVPDPEDDSIEISSIFKITGSCYFSSFSFFDADPAVAAYSDYANTKRVPTYSHHKLTAFTYADGVNKVRLGNEQIDLTDLDMYYYKVSRAYASIPDYTLDISPVVDEYRIVGELRANSIGISSIRSGNGLGSGLRNEITVTTADALTKIIEPHGLFPDSPILISGVDVDASAYNGSFTVKSIVSPTEFTYTSNATPVNSLPSISQIQNATVVVESDSVSSSSPYIFSCSLRSVYGLCGLWADGSKADGFKSVVVAQFTGVSLQKDDNAFIVYKNGTYSDNVSLPANSVERPLHTNSNAIYKPNYENFHIRATNDAYMQCVSVFAIGYARHFSTESGADIDITNSNSNFGSCALESSGFKSTSFDRDDCGYITHIIPPRELEYRTNRINWLTLDIALTKTSSSRLYLYGYKDAGVLPPNKTEGYRVGAKVDELLYLSTDLSSPVLMPVNTGSGISAKKVYTVSRNNLGVNSISSDEITFTSTHQLSDGEKVRIFSNTGQSPDGLETNVIYYAIRISSTKIALASTYNDATADSPISITGINNNGGILTIISSVTDKIPGDVGHPIQYDEILNNWYVNSSPNNEIYTNLLTSTEIETSFTAIVRRPETRSVEDRLYKIRYVIPKEFTNARPPEYGFILQESKSVETSSFSANSAELSNTIALRNDKVIRSASVGSILNNSQIVTIQTEVPHKFIVGDTIKTQKITSTNNPTATGIVSTYNGTYEIASVPSSNTFTYVLKGANTNPGTFTNNLSVRNTVGTYSQLPVVSRVAYKNSFFIYRINTIKPLIPVSPPGTNGPSGQDGIYLLTVLSSNINIPTSYGYDLYKKEFNQDVRNLYPQVDRDNYNSDPTATATFADLKTLGKVITNDKKNSITKEALNYFIKNTQLGFEITGVTLSGVGNTTITLTTNVEHKLNSILTTSNISGSSGLSNGNYYGYPLYLGTTLTDATCNFTSSNFESTGGTVSAFKILDPGSNFNVDDILTIGTSGDATFTVSSINDNVGDGLQLSGFLQNELNGVFKILNTTNSKSVTIQHPNGVSTYIPNTNSELPFALLSSENITATLFSFTNISSGIVTVTTSPAHGLFVGNKITIVGTGRTIYDKDFVVNSVLTLNTFTIKVEGATSIPSSSLGTVFKHTLSANAKVLGSGEENLASRASYIYGGIRKTLSDAISSTDTVITLNRNGLSRGDYVQINGEVLRLASNPSGNTFTVLRSQFGTIKTTAAVGTIVTKIKVLPMEVRRPSFMMASGHTFRYLGYGSGNYSTAVPQKQNRVLTDDEILKSQSKEISGGTVIYNGLNDRGDSFDGAKKLSASTGQETVVDAPIITFTGDDVDSDSVSIIEGIFDTLLVRNKITVEGGLDGNETSVFYGPVKVDNTVKVNELEFNSLDGSGSTSIVSTNSNTIYTGASVGIGKNLDVGVDLSVTGATTLTGLLDANNGATIDNIRIGVANDNEIDTAPGTGNNLILDSDGGTVEIDDNLEVKEDLYVGKNGGGNSTIYFYNDSSNTYANRIEFNDVAGTLDTNSVAADTFYFSSRMFVNGALGVAGATTLTGRLDANDGATIDNIRIGVANDNEIDTAPGTGNNLILDSDGGTVEIDDNLTVSGIGTFTGNGAIKIPVGGDGSRPTPAAGMIRFNNNINSFEGYNGTEWGLFLAKTGNVANIKDYGAVGDGDTDDSDAIQDALNDSTVSIIGFPAGTYIVRRTLVFNPTTTRYSAKFVGMDGFASQSKIFFKGMDDNTNYPEINGNGSGKTAGTGGISMAGCTAPGKVGIWFGFKFRAENMGFESDTAGLSGSQKEELCTLRFERTYIPDIDDDSDEADMDSSLFRCNFDGGNGTNEGIDGAATISYVGRNMLIEGCSFTGNNTNIALKFPNNPQAPTSTGIGVPGNAYQGTPFGHRKNQIINCVFHLAGQARAIAIYGNHTCHGLLIANNIIDIGGQLLLVTGSGGISGAVINGNSCFNGESKANFNLLSWIQVGVSLGNSGGGNTKFVNSCITGNVFAGIKYRSDEFFGAGTPLVGFATDVRRYRHSIAFNAGSRVRNVTISGNSFLNPTDHHIAFENEDTVTGLSTCIVRRVSITGNTFTRRDDSLAKGIVFFDRETSAIVSGNTINADKLVVEPPGGYIGLGTIIHQNLNLFVNEEDGD